MAESNSSNTEVKQEMHPDGVWWTSYYTHKGCKIIIKSRENYGMKSHCIEDDIVIFTERFRYVDPQYLYERMVRKIDKWKSGEWTPKKLRKD